MEIKIKITGVNQLKQDIEAAKAKTLQGSMDAVSKAVCDLRKAVADSLGISSLIYWLNKRYRHD